jgi:hypothetical protein
LGDGVHDDSASAGELAALDATVLRCHGEFVRTLQEPRSVRAMRRLRRLHLAWLALPWVVVEVGRTVLSEARPGFPACEEQAASLYRRLSGKDPHVAQAEVVRIVMQLGALDERVRGPLDEARPGAPRGADPGEVQAAAGALLGYYLAGRWTDDELLAEVEAAWAEYEELSERWRRRAMERGMRSLRRADPTTDWRLQAAGDRYRVAWRRWLDRQAEHGTATGPGAR